MDKSGRPKPRLLPLLQAVLVLAVLAMLVFLWKDLTALKTSQQSILEENKALQQKLTQARTEVETLTPVVKQLREAAEARFPEASTNALFQLTRELASGTIVTVTPVPRPTRTPVPEPNHLVLAQKTIQKTATGFTSQLRFEPTGERPLDAFAIVVRLPGNSTARILDLNTTGDATFAGQRVQITNKFAVFQGTPESLAAIEINLSVSGEATAEVHASNGLKPFTIEFQ